MQFHNQKSCKQEKSKTLTIPQFRTNWDISHTGAAAVVAKGAGRVADLLLDGVEGEEAAGIFVGEEGGPGGHAVDGDRLLRREAGEERPDVVPERAAGGDLRAPWIHERAQAEHPRERRPIPAEIRHGAGGAVRGRMGKWRHCAVLAGTFGKWRLPRGRNCPFPVILAFP